MSTYTFKLGGDDIDAAAKEFIIPDYIPGGIYAPYAGEGVTGGTPGGSSPFTQTLADFAGLDVQGDWTLNISDRDGSETGSFESWSFGVNQLAPPVVAAPEPGTLALFGLALPLAGLVRRRKV